jgi:hypothetical protein
MVGSHSYGGKPCRWPKKMEVNVDSYAKKSQLIEVVNAIMEAMRVTKELPNS